MNESPTKYRKKKRFLNQVEKEEICKLYSEGMKCDEIGKVMNSDPSWIVKIVKKAGVWEDKVQRYQDIGRSLNKRERAILVELHNSGLNHREISLKMGVSYDAVAKTSLRLGLKGHIRTYWLDENWLDEINSPEKAIYLGLFFADGCNVSNSSACTIYLNENDKAYLEGLRSFFTERPLTKRRISKYKNRNSSDQWGIDVSSVLWTRNLSRYGAVPAKSLILDWPEDLPDEMTKYFIRGFFEGDGGICVSKGYKKPYYTICITSTKEFLKKCSSEIESRLKIKTYIYKAHKNKKNTYVLRINRQKDVKTFLDWIYKDCLSLVMKRKFTLYQNLIQERFPESLNKL